MNLRNASIPVRLATAATALFLASCGDDPELLKKREEQRAEIGRLHGELAVLQEKLGDIPPDRGEELEDLKRSIEVSRTKAEALEDEIARLEKEKDEVESELNAYRRKYVLRDQ